MYLKFSRVRCVHFQSGFFLPISAAAITPMISAILFDEVLIWSIAITARPTTSPRRHAAQVHDPAAPPGAPHVAEEPEDVQGQPSTWRRIFSAAMSAPLAPSAAANTLIQGAAMTAAPKGVCINAFGTNFLNYPDAVNSYGGPDKMAAVASNIPVGRFGEPEEMAHMAMPLLDGYNMFTTGQSIMVAGGYNVKLDSIASLASG